VSTGVLWLVATPIGTAEDLSPRAVRVLREADLILAEDTRRTRALLARWGVPAGRRLRAFHEHNEARRTPEVVAALERGLAVALVSDAGTPVLSDPGYRLVRAARERGLAVLSVPGPSAFTAALAASGQPPLPATLVGFLPPRRGRRRAALEALRDAPGTLVIFLSPHRLPEELAAVAGTLGPGRPATLLAELSKVHERAVTGTLAELAASSEVHAPRGEYVLVVAPGAASRTAPVTPERAREVFRRTSRGARSRGEALRRAADELGLRRRELERLLERAVEP